MTANAVTYFQVLYTANLTQKRKKWFDGQCVFSSAQHKVKLLDEDGRLLAEDRWNTDLPEVGSQHQCERFLVEIDSLVRTTTVKPITNTAQPAGRVNSVPNVDRVPLPNMGPSLAEVLPVVGRLTPISTNDVALGRIYEPLVTKRRKYAPWGDVNALPPLAAPCEAEPLHFSEPNNDLAHQWKAELPSSPRVYPESPSTTNHDELPTTEPDEPLFVDDLDSDLVAPSVYHLESDLESDLEITETKPASHKSLFTDLPRNTPQEGPWTKEAYLLFSWHPPVVKPEVE